MDQGAVFSTGKSGPISLRQTKKSISGERFFVRLRLIFRCLPGDFRGTPLPETVSIVFLGGWAWHALFFL